MIELEDYIEQNDTLVNDENTALAHHGILGMKWYHKNGPPYPLGSGDHSSAEKSAASKAGVRVGTSSGKFGAKTTAKPKQTFGQKRAAKKLQKQRVENLQKARAAKQTKEEHEAARQRALKSGDPAQIQKYLSESSNQEIQDAVNRMNLYAQVNSKVPKQQTAMDKINKVVNTADQINNWANTGMKIYNNVAKVYNSLNDEGDDLPYLGQDNSNRKSAKDKAREKYNNQLNKSLMDAARRGDWDTLAKYQNSADQQTISNVNSYLKQKKKYQNYIKSKGNFNDKDNN